jgi:predicted site-specific integrase-resolvase
MEPGTASPFISTWDAAIYLNVSPTRLQKWRRDGCGPVYRKFGGKIRYHVDELRAWADAQRRTSTSDPSKAA